MSSDVAYSEDTPPLNYSSLSTEAIRLSLRAVTLPLSSSRAKFRNWGKTYSCTPTCVFEPENETHCRLILELARRDGTTLRACGAGHSPSDLACTSGYLLRTDKLDRVLQVRFSFPSYRLYVEEDAGDSNLTMQMAVCSYLIVNSATFSHISNF